VAAVERAEPEVSAGERSPRVPRSQGHLHEEIEACERGRRGRPSRTRRRGRRVRTPPVDLTAQSS
jgi:hypothetical protein